MKLSTGSDFGFWENLCKANKGAKQASRVLKRISTRSTQANSGVLMMLSQDPGTLTLGLGKSGDCSGCSVTLLLFLLLTNHDLLPMPLYRAKVDNSTRRYLGEPSRLSKGTQIQSLQKYIFSISKHIPLALHKGIMFFGPFFY